MSEEDARIHAAAAAAETRDVAAECRPSDPVMRLCSEMYRNYLLFRWPIFVLTSYFDRLSFAIFSLQ